MGLHRADGKGVKLGRRHRLRADSFLLLQIMGKRSGLFFAILLVASVVQVNCQLLLLSPLLVPIRSTAHQA